MPIPSIACAILHVWFAMPLASAVAIQSSQSAPTKTAIAQIDIDLMLFDMHALRPSAVTSPIAEIGVLVGPTAGFTHQATQCQGSIGLPIIKGYAQQTHLEVSHSDEAFPPKQIQLYFEFIDNQGVWLVINEPIRVGSGGGHRAIVSGDGRWLLVLSWSRYPRG